MGTAALKYPDTEFIIQKDHQVRRYPTLNTVLMVEEFLKLHRDLPLKISEIKKMLPRQVMHGTLQLILEYLWKSGKIIYGPKGVQWIYSEPEHLKKMFNNTLQK